MVMTSLRHSASCRWRRFSGDSNKCCSQRGLNSFLYKIRRLHKKSLPYLWESGSSHDEILFQNHFIIRNSGSFYSFSYVELTLINKLAKIGSVIRIRIHTKRKVLILRKQHFFIKIFSQKSRNRAIDFLSKWLAWFEAFTNISLIIVGCFSLFN